MEAQYTSNTYGYGHESSCDVVIDCVILVIALFSNSIGSMHNF